MKSISVFAIVILVLVSIAAFAQRPQDFFGNTELGPSGYIDFYGLPTPPSPAGDSPSVPKVTDLAKKLLLLPPFGRGFKMGVPSPNPNVGSRMGF
jgi:hypothetical protein